MNKLLYHLQLLICFLFLSLVVTGQSVKDFSSVGVNIQEIRLGTQHADIKVFLTKEAFLSNRSSRTLQDLKGHLVKGLKYYDSSISIVQYLDEILPSDLMLESIYGLGKGNDFYINPNLNDTSTSGPFPAWNNRVWKKTAFVKVETKGDVVVLYRKHEQLNPSCHNCPRRMTEMRESRHIYDTSSGKIFFFTLQGLERFLVNDYELLNKLNQDWGILDRLNNGENISNDLLDYLKLYNAKQR